MDSLPAILIGGPPHAGKSVLFYVKHMHFVNVIFPITPFELVWMEKGNWSQESHPNTVSQNSAQYQDDMAR